MLLTPYNLQETPLQNRVVMAPMTRNRAINNVPNNLMADYYRQRASAGLIITEGVSPSENGLGYARVPGMFNKNQFMGWKRITDVVHQRSGKVFMQLMHTGRVSHLFNLPIGSRIIAPSAIPMTGSIWTDKDGMQSFEIPEAMDDDDINEVKAEFVQAARCAVEAGFDGVELNAANGYLLEQFISPITNMRSDQYGGKRENRTRLVIEIATAMAEAIGRNRVGVKISPYGTENEMKRYDDIDETYQHLTLRLDHIGLAYLHVSDEHGIVSGDLIKDLRFHFSNTLIRSGGFTQSTADEVLARGEADLIAFGKSFIVNPDLVERFHKRLPLNFRLDASKLHSPGARGFTDYPVFDEEFVGV